MSTLRIGPRPAGDLSSPGSSKTGRLQVVEPQHHSKDPTSLVTCTASRAMEAPFSMLRWAFSGYIWENPRAFPTGAGGHERPVRVARDPAEAEVRARSGHRPWSRHGGKAREE